MGLLCSLRTCRRFGDGVAEGSAGGTGIRIYNGGLFAEQNDKIIRYPLPANGFVPSEQPHVIVSGLPLTGDHPMHPFIIDAEGHLFVDLGSATNSCQKENRIANSPGYQPCIELQTRAGTWLYDANKEDQHVSPKERYATGLRNGEGFAFDAAGRLFATMHGRDQLSQNWPSLFTADQNAQLQPRKSCNWKKAPIMAGQNAITMAFKISWCWHLSTVATARRPEYAPTRKLRSLPFQGIGRRTIC